MPVLSALTAAAFADRSPARATWGFDDAAGTHGGHPCPSANVLSPIAEMRMAWSTRVKGRAPVRQSL